MSTGAGEALLTRLGQRTGVDRRHVSRCPIRLEDFRCDFLSMHRHASRRFDPDPYLVASNVEDPHDDVRADHDRLVGTTAQDEHGSPPGLARDRFAGGVFGVSEHHLAPDTRSIVYHQRTEKIRRDRGDTAVLGVPDRDERKHVGVASVTDLERRDVTIGNLDVVVREESERRNHEEGKIAVTGRLQPQPPFCVINRDPNESDRIGKPQQATIDRDELLFGRVEGSKA